MHAFTRCFVEIASHWLRMRSVNCCLGSVNIPGPDRLICPNFRETLATCSVNHQRFLWSNSILHQNRLLYKYYWGIVEILEGYFPYSIIHERRLLPRESAVDFFCEVSLRVLWEYLRNLFLTVLFCSLHVGCTCIHDSSLNKMFAHRARRSGTADDRGCSLRGWLYCRAIWLIFRQCLVVSFHICGFLCFISLVILHISFRWENPFLL